ASDGRDSNSKSGSEKFVKGGGGETRSICSPGELPARPRPMRFLRRRADGTLMALVEEAGRNVQRSGLLLHDLLADYPEHATLAQDLKVCEQEGDRITHDIIHRLAGRHVRAP